jgi:hypothetical protein
MMRRNRAPLFAVLALLLASPAHAQNPAQTLERIAAAWHKGDANAITALAARAGISVDVDGRAVGPLGARQAAAVLRRVFGDRESVSARTSMSRATGNDRAFGEISWSMKARGTTIPERATIFVALIREDGDWRVSEIRLLQ